MRSFLAKTIQRLRRCQSGNALLIVAMGTPVLIGGAGFAVDTAQWYMWKRELQHSVDQAALAGAYALLNDDTADYETRAENEFGRNQDKTADFDSALAVRLADYAGGDDNSVIATASASKRLPFSGFFLDRAITVNATAQATFTPGGSYEACLVSTATDGTGTSIGNNATVTAECGLAALSCEDYDTSVDDGNGTGPADDGDNVSAIEIDPGATVTADVIYACGSVNAPNVDSDISENLGNVLIDEYEDLPVPDNPTSRTYKCDKIGNGQNAVNQASLKPGTYNNGISISCTTYCEPGIYVIDGGVLDLAGNYDVTCNGVMFVLKNGARIKFTGNGGNGQEIAPTNTINLTPMTAAQVEEAGYPALADRYAGMLIFEDRNNNPQSPGHRFGGNANSVIEGVVYLPDGEVTVIGTAKVSSQCLQISAYRINVAGGAELETFCPRDSTTNAGSAAAKLRLVA